MKFRICADSITYYYAEVEADSFEEARKIYEDMDGGEFKMEGYGDWELSAITCNETGETISYI